MREGSIDFANDVSDDEIMMYIPTSVIEENYPHINRNCYEDQKQVLLSSDVKINLHNLGGEPCD